MKFSFLVFLWYSPIMANENLQTRMANCLQYIADQYISSTIMVIVSNNTQPKCQIRGRTTSHLLSEKLYVDDPTSNHKVIKKLQSSFKWPLMIFQISVGHISQEGYSTYILISDHCNNKDIMQEIRYQISKVKNNKLYSVNSKLIVAITNKLPNPRIIVENILSILREFKIVNVIVLIPSEADVSQDDFGSSTLDVYTWFPYQDEGYCANVTNPTLLDRWISSDKGQNFLFKNALFPHKIPPNFRACPVVVSTFEYAPFVLKMKKEDNVISFEGGIELALLLEFARRMNLTIKYKEPSPDLWGTFLENGTWIGAPGEVGRGLSDMTVIGFWTTGVIPGLEYSVTYLIDYLTWYVPRAKPIPRWKSLIRVFKLSLWLGFLLSYVIVSKLMSQIAKWSYNSSEDHPYSSFARCLLYFWAIIVEESASNNPPNVTAIRFVFLTWVLYCWAINTVYQTFLVSFLVNPGLEHQISTETEIIESDLALGITESVGDCCIPDVDRYPRRDRCGEDFRICMDRAAVKNELAVIFGHYSGEHLIHTSYMGSDGSPLVYKLQQEVTFLFITTPFIKGSYFRDSYDKVVHRVIQAGLLKYWWDSLEYTTTLSTVANFEEEDGEYVKLSMDHMESAFIFVIFAYTTTTVVFIVEFITGTKICKINSRSNFETQY
ncbi:Ionotropic receptor 577 [Blattella germanica]|nr:Ionotropic receptor 577 [Blattella germanica]